MLKKAFSYIWNSIAEPRVQRVIQFGIYLWLFVSGLLTLCLPPVNITDSIGLILTYVFGSFIFFGALAGGIAVLPGIWWLERVGVILLFTALMMYVVVAIVWGLSPIGVALIIAFAICFVQRWFEIRGAQLAPKKE